MDYQEVYEELKIQLKELEDELKLLYLNGDILVKEYKIIKDSLFDKEFLLTSFDRQRKELLKIKYKYIYVILSSIPSVIISFLPLIVGSVFQNSIFNFLFQNISLSKIYLSIIFLVFTEVIAGLIAKEVSNIIYNRLTYNIYNKIINSKEYQDILVRINDIELEINNIRNDLRNKNQERKELDSKIGECKKEISNVKGLMNYTKSKFDSKENNLSISRMKRING